MAITSTTLRLHRRLQNQLDHITDTQVRDLVAAWAAAWDEVEGDLVPALLEQLVAGDRVTRAQLLRSVRLRNALVVVREQLEELAGRAGVRITEDLELVVDTAGGAQASIIDSQLPPNAGHLVELDTWTRVDERQIAAIVRRSTEQITSRLRPLPREVDSVIRRELIRGVASGSNPHATAARMVRRAEKHFNGTLGLTRALRVASTEILDAHRAAAQLGQAAHADVLTGWTWLSTLDHRTCPSCWSKHGSTYPLDVPGPDDHQQGRCGRMPTVMPWADLGFDIPEPPSMVPDAAVEFDRLSPDDQRTILGPARYAAWARGDFPMSDWSVRRTTAGWRDSWGVAPLPRHSARVGAA